MRRLGLTIAALAAASFLWAEDVPNAATLRAVEEILADSDTQAVQQPYSRAVPAMWLGYDTAGKPVVGVAIRRVKSYEEVTVLVVVRVKDGAYVVDHALVPDAGVIENEKKRRNVTEAASRCAGITVRTVDGKTNKIDAVAGATRYTKRIYATFDYLAREVVKTIQENPGWPRARIGK